MPDIIILGSGPAGLSAAITARQRDLSALVISGDRTHSGLYKAREVGNYPGLPGITGQELSDRLVSHAVDMGTEIITGRVTNIVPVGSSVSVAFGNEIKSAPCVILATGIVQSGTFPGEAEHLGRGVSYCATCDGMLYRNKRVVVVCLSPEAEAEADYLQSIGCEVARVKTKKVTINGEGGTVKSVTADGEEIACAGVFILRQTVAPQLLLQGLKMERGHIAVDSAMRTSVPGVFAAGDCTGQPYQIAKAAGQGQVAALSAADYIMEKSGQKTGGAAGEK